MREGLSYQGDLMAITKKLSLMGEFMDFLREYKVVPLAIAFIMGVAATALIKSLVDNIIMPTISPLIPGGVLKTFVLVMGPFSWGVGPFIGDIINFIIIAFVVFLMAKLIMREEKVSKK
jgi:large conductance mechanosensitive channel